MEETIYVVEDDDEEDEVVKVRKRLPLGIAELIMFTEYQKAVGDVICQGSVPVHESSTYDNKLKLLF